MDCAVWGALVCEVEGGPEYNLGLKGRCSDMLYTVEPQALDFGEQPFVEVFSLFQKIAGFFLCVFACETNTQEVTISNNSFVDFDFEVDLTTLKSTGVVRVEPVLGTIKSGQKQNLKVPLSYFEAKLLE